VIAEYLRRFSDELERRGVRAGDRRRVLAESEDHLRELSAAHGEAEAVERFGDSRELAGEIASQLATTKTIRSTYATFAALVLTAFAYLALIAYSDRVGPADLLAGKHEAVGVLATLGLLLLPQVAFVAGGLALLRALRRRGRAALSCEELDVLGRRSAVALAAGFSTVAAMLLWGYEFGHFVPVLALALVGLIPLLAVAPALALASSPQGRSAGPPQDVFDDLRLEGLRSRPWLFAVAVGLVSATVAFAFNGIVLAALEFAALLLCFAALGRPLALRR
jgi:hypothetical protein